MKQKDVEQKDMAGYSEEDKKEQKEYIKAIQVQQSEYEIEISELKKKMAVARKGLKAISKQVTAQLELYYRMTQ